MSSDEKVFDFPKAEITSEEKVRRARAEAKRLASLAPGEWRLWIDRAAERLGVPRATLEGLISAIIKDSERKAREDKAETRRQEERVRREQRERKREQQGIDKKAERKSKEKQKAFERLISLPSEQHETRLAELAKRFDEDVAAIRHDFTAFVGMESWASSRDPWPGRRRSYLAFAEVETPGRLQGADRRLLAPARARTRAQRTIYRTRLPRVRRARRDRNAG